VKLAYDRIDISVALPSGDTKRIDELNSFTIKVSSGQSPVFMKARCLSLVPIGPQLTSSAAPAIIAP
jgi:hypothetical protein